MSHVDFMKKALRLAEEARALDEVPVGALILDADNHIIGEGYNRTRLDKDPSAHAEIVTIRDACGKLNQHRLDGCTIVVTLEPCAMCAQALAHARIKCLIYGAADPKGGAVENGVRLFDQKSYHHKIEVIPNIMAENCGQILRDFFVDKRRSVAK